MAGYGVRIKRSAAKELGAIPIKDRKRIVTRIESLRADPRSPGREKLSGKEKYRIHQGDHRILHEIVDHELIVTVVRIGNRRGAHR